MGDNHPGVVSVRLDTDPYDVCVTSEYVRKSTADSKTNPNKESTKMPTTATKPKARELRREAKALGVEGWEDMDLDELIAAVEEAKEGAKPAKKSAAKKGKKAAPVVEDDDEDEDDEDEDDEDDEEDEDDEPAPKSKKSSKKAAAKPAKKASKAVAKASGKDKAATKKVAKKAKDDDEDLPENGNPFQQGSNLYWMAEELIKGGKRSSMVKRLSKKITLKPRTREFTEEEELKEIDRRLVIVSQVLRNDHGFEMEREGRGLDTQIRLWKE